MHGIIDEAHRVMKIFTTSGISIVILTVGTDERIRYLDQLLKSIERQTVKSFELIIASETSKGRLEDLLRKYFPSNEDCRILVAGYWNKCKTANKAIKEAKGGIIFLLEDDLVLRENFIEEMLKTFDLDPKIGCVYSQCMWVYPEGLRSKGGIKGFVARLISKLSIHESVLPRHVKKIDEYLYEVPVFTMSVACRKDVLLKIGLYDESVNEPISGEDYDLALRIRRSGYKIVQNVKAVSYHHTRQVSKKLSHLSTNPEYLRGLNKSEVYFIVKNRNMLGFCSTLLHVAYRILESIAWASRTRRPSTLIYGVTGTIEGLAKGLMFKWQTN